MKTLTTHLSAMNEKELVLKMVLLSTITFGVYALKANRNVKSQAPVRANVHSDDQFGNFDKASVPNKTSIISKMISTLKPELSMAERHAVASHIYHALKKYDISPQIVVAIVDTESRFNQGAISSTGDLSIAQVNPEIWNREFERMNMAPLDVARLKTDVGYSVVKMVEILHILKTRYGKTDRRWYARYHSKTKMRKAAYLAKLEGRMKQLERIALRSKLVAML